MADTYNQSYTFYRYDAYDAYDYTFDDVAKSPWYYLVTVEP